MKRFACLAAALLLVFVGCHKNPPDRYQLVSGSMIRTEDTIQDTVTQSVEFYVEMEWNDMIGLKTGISPDSPADGGSYPQSDAGPLVRGRVQLDGLNLAQVPDSAGYWYLPAAYDFTSENEAHLKVAPDFAPARIYYLQHPDPFLTLETSFPDTINRTDTLRFRPTGIMDDVTLTLKKGNQHFKKTFSSAQVAPRTPLDFIIPFAPAGLCTLTVDAGWYSHGGDTNYGMDSIILSYHLKHIQEIFGFLAVSCG